MEGLVGFHGEEVGHRHAADLGDAAEVVAHQVDDHEVLGALLLVLAERGLGLLVGCGIRSAGSGSLHGPRRDDPVMLGDEQLGAGRQHGECARIHDAAIGDGLALPQRAIEREGRALQPEAGLERQVQLIDVARLDVPLHHLEALGIGLLVPGGNSWRETEALALGLLVQPSDDVGFRQRLRRLEEAEPEQWYGTVSRQEMHEARLQQVAELVAEEARGMEAVLPSLLEPPNGTGNLPGLLRRDTALELREQQRGRTVARTVVQEHERPVGRQRLVSVRVRHGVGR